MQVENRKSKNEKVKIGERQQAAELNSGGRMQGNIYRADRIREVEEEVAR